jgi:ankyrin repeat protein
VNKEFGGRKALHFAADYGHNEIIEYLLSHGADEYINVSRLTLTTGHAGGLVITHLDQEIQVIGSTTSVG